MVTPGGSVIREKTDGFFLVDQKEWFSLGGGYSGKKLMGFPWWIRGSGFPWVKIIREKN